MDTHVSPAELAELVTVDGAVRVVDVRSALDDPGIAEYRRGHLPGAVHLPWPEWSDRDDPVPGQLAPPEVFARVLGRAGIGPDTTVVAYDDAVHYLAYRLAWALRHYGHRAVRVLEGGLPAWERAGMPVAIHIPEPEPRDYPVPESPGARGRRSDLDEVLAAVRGGGARLVDCRWEGTYRDAGAHIPGATRFPSPSLFDAATGRMRAAAELRRQAEDAGLTPDGEAILYCGAGVSAAAVQVALDDLGFHRLKVYDGSWFEWSAAEVPCEPH